MIAIAGVSMARKILVTILGLSITIPLMCIAISIALSPWFSITTNALSDLGHATRSCVAPIFNLGLSLGGILIVIVAVSLFNKVHNLLATSIAVTGCFLVLVAVFDKVYGHLHYWVSVLFFLSLCICLISYGTSTRNVVKRALAIVALIVSITLWILHLLFRIPRGAAIPELVSIIAVIPFYIDAATRYLK